MQKAGLQRSPAFCLLISLFRVCELSLYQTAPYRDSNAQSVGTALAAVRSRIYNKLGQRALFLLQRRFLRAFQQMHTEFLCVKPILLYEHPAKEVLLCYVVYYFCNPLAIEIKLSSCLSSSVFAAEYSSFAFDGSEASVSKKSLGEIFRNSQM